MVRRARVLALVACLAALAACGSDKVGSATTSGATPTTLGSVTTTPPSSGPADTSPPSLTPVSAVPGDVPAALRPAVEAATADLATRLNIDSDSIVVTSATEVTWPNSAAGCEQPGMAYMQVLVDGAEVILASNGVAYRYTSDGSGDPKLCEQQG